MGDREEIWVRPPQGTEPGGTFRFRLDGPGDDDNVVAYVLTLRTSQDWQDGLPIRLTKGCKPRPIPPAPAPPAGLPAPAPTGGALPAAAAAITHNSGYPVAYGATLKAPIPAALDTTTASSSSSSALQRYAVNLPQPPWVPNDDPLLLVSLPDRRMGAVRVPQGNGPSGTPLTAGETLCCVPEQQEEEQPAAAAAGPPLLRRRRTNT